jgi:hypothetical protein
VLQFPTAKAKIIIPYVVEQLKERKRDILYQVYITDALKGLTGASVRWFDMVSDDFDKEQKKTPEQIKEEIFDVFKKLEVR